MSTRYAQWCLWGGLLALVAMTAEAGFIDHNFDVAPFTNGATFMDGGLMSDWRAASASVRVTTTAKYTPPHSIVLPEGSALSNAVALTPASHAWTDFRLAPMLGVAPASSATNGASFICYFASNGYVNVWAGSGWQTCSNDVWNHPISPLTNAIFATISIYQDYAAQRAAIMVNDRVVAQDLPFVTTTNRYGHFMAENNDNSAWLDDVRIQTSYDASRLSANVNGVDDVDAAELQNYGYVARTLYVGTGQPYAYATLSNALAVARDRDTLYVVGAAYAESVTVTQDLTLAGSFTNSGTITVAAGSVVSAVSNFVSSLTVSGRVDVAQGIVVSGAVVTVAGNGLITVATNSAQLLAGDLNITGSGVVDVTGGQVADAAAGVGMAGTFALSNTWGTAAVANLDVHESFDLYAPNTRLQALGFSGWGASSTGVVVQASAGYEPMPSQGVRIPEASLISNRVAAASVTKVWTDFRLKPMVGEKPSAPETNNTAFLSYVSSNGVLNVWSGGWIPCTNYINGSSVAVITTGEFVRVTVFANFDSDKAAVFVNGKLARELVSFPSPSVGSYSSFQTANSDANAYLDDVHITTGVPTDLLPVTPSTDLDADGTADAEEIDLYNSVWGWSGPRTLFQFR
ncbi:MAG: LamG domain-containing protein [Lentisphaerae bacterium]|nr:LamG domain-containing protein [Lentisphaerota bacterium]